MSISIGFNYFSNCVSFLPSICSNLFKSPFFLSSFSNPLLKTLRNQEYSNLACLTTPDLYPKPSPVSYSYLSNYLDDNAEILATSLSNPY